MKSLQDYAVAICCSILDDAAGVWPQLSTSMERDKTRLRRVSEQRGFAFFTLTLPELGKFLDMGLSESYYCQTSIPHGIRVTDDGYPELYQGLFRLVFGADGVLLENPSIEAIAFLRQLTYCFKKYRLECKDTVTRKTVKEFFDIESGLPVPVSGWNDEVPSWASDSSRLSRHPHTGVTYEKAAAHTLFGEVEDEESSAKSNDYTFDPLEDIDWCGSNLNGFLLFCRRVIRSEFGEMPDWDLFPKHGPGATAEFSRGGGFKYSFQNWPRKLNNRFPYDWFGSGNMQSGIDSEVVRGGDIEEMYPYPDDREPASRLIAVPKTQKGPRLICAEPVAHQWMQQGIREWLEKSVAKSSLFSAAINFSSQQRSRDLALHSSLSGSHVTIDLSSASDRLSCNLVESVFHGSHTILDALHAARSRMITQRIDKALDSHLVLRKFSTQGSALTFPVQTIVYTCIAVYAYLEGRFNGELHTISDGQLREAFKQVQVFGDDIIVPKDSHVDTQLLLEELGLKVNPSKTHWAGWFRESCGMDAFKGVDVTPAYILGQYDASPEATASVVEQSNNFHSRGYWKTASYILSTIPNKELKKLFIGSYKNGGTQGPLSVKTFCNGEPNTFSKWDDDLQVAYGNFLSIKNASKKSSQRGVACLTQYFTEKPDVLDKWMSGLVGPAKLKKTLGRVQSRG